MSVDFEPVRLGGRRRRIDPAVVVAGVVMAALIVAVIKPWDRTVPSAPAPPPVAAATTPSGSPAAATATSSPTPLPDEPDFWEILEPVIGGHDEWGVLGVVADVSSSTPDGAPAGLSGRWAAGTPTPDGDVEVALAPGALPVYLLGLTFPAGDAPSDVRFWLVRPDGNLDWIDAVLLPPGLADVPRLFVRSPGPDPEPWAAGRYRIDVLHGERVERLTLRLADAQGNVPPPTPRPVFEPGLIVSSDSDPSGVRSGLFATVDGLGVPLDAAVSRPLDEADAWLAAGQPAGGGAAPVVASAFLPRATGLGVMLAPNASVQLAVLRRLAPSPLAPAPPARGGISGIQGWTPYAVFAAPDHQALASGVYAVSVGWSDADGLQAATWHVELRPGPPFNLGS